MKLILAGATGFTGREVMKQALADPEIERVLVLTRRPTGQTHTKLTEQVLPDFLDYSAVDLRGYDACIWTLGVSQAGIDEAEYIKITLDYTLAAARALYAASPHARFLLVTGRSSDPDEQGKSLFSRIKGRSERQLTELAPSNAFVFRPGYIRPTERSVPRKDIGRFFAPIFGVIDSFTDNLSIDCDALAHALLAVAKKGSTEHLFGNAAMKKLAS
jgi:uncharacterized protein YbjT (DUF2867 family)